MKSLSIISLLLIAHCCYAVDKNAAVTPTVVLATSSSWDGEALHYPAGQAKITGMQIDIAVNGETGWHQHPVPSFGIVLAGELEISLRSGLQKKLKAGDTFAEVVNTEHNGRNIGSEPVRLLIFYAGSTDKPLTIKEPKP